VGAARRSAHPDAGDYHLEEGCQAIDAGTPTDAPALDLENHVRPADAGFDIGAYEYGSVLVDGGTEPQAGAGTGDGGGSGGDGSHPSGSAGSGGSGASSRSGGCQTAVASAPGLGAVLLALALGRRRRRG
jgi:MYXO-CTERM domain-containing protein